MSTPWKIACKNPEEVPSVEEILRFADGKRHVVLVLTATPENKAAKPQIIERLARALPDHRVFDSGGQISRPLPPRGGLRRWLGLLRLRAINRAGPTTWITIIKVISQSDVLAHADLIVAAAREFRATARALMTRLAGHLGVPLEAFADPLFRMTYEPGAPQPRGDLGDGWEFWFHGFECRFTNRITGQNVEVKLGYLNEFGVLDPWFFAHYLSSTPGMEVVRALFEDDFHNPARALEVLEQHGHLTRVSGHREEPPLSGLVALDRQTAA